MFDLFCAALLLMFIGLKWAGIIAFSWWWAVAGLVAYACAKYVWTAITT